MNVLLLQPKFLTSETTFPLGLAYLASSLIEANHRVFGIDCAFHDLNVIKETIFENNIKLIGISCHSYNYAEVILLSSMLKTYFNIPIVCGGIHCTLFPEKVISEKHIDFVISGAGEKGIVSLANCIEQNKDYRNIPSLIYKDTNGNVFINQQSSLVDDLSEISFPDRKIFPVRSYFGVNSKNKYYTPIITSRGCNHTCNYCPVNKLWGGWCARSAYDVVNEIETVLREYKIKEFHIEDDNFTPDHSRVVSICKEIIRRNLHIDWQCTNGLYPEDMHPSIIQKMAQSGCYRIALGIESFNKKLLDRMGRKLNIERISDIITTAHKYSVEVVGYFILGLQGETLDSIKATIRLSRKLRLNLAIYSLFHAIPGSTIFENIKFKFPYEQIISKRVSLCSVDINQLSKIKKMAYVSLLLNKRTRRFILRSLNSVKNIKNFLIKLKEHALI